MRPIAARAWAVLSPVVQIILFNFFQLLSFEPLTSNRGCRCYSRGKLCNHRVAGPVQGCSQEKQSSEHSTRAHVMSVIKHVGGMWICVCYLLQRGPHSRCLWHSRHPLVYLVARGQLQVEIAKKCVPHSLSHTCVPH